MSDQESYPFSTWGLGPGPPGDDWGPPIALGLERHGDPSARSAGGPRPPVLLLHGASACHRTFEVPDGGLAAWLFARGFDPWLLNWRGSHLVVGADANQLSLRNDPDIYNFNKAAAEDLPAAIRTMRAQGVSGPIALVGHCMGSGVVAEAVALGRVTASDVDRIVLIALGLFYDAPVDSRLKSEERILERLAQQVVIDPRMVAGAAGGLESEWPPDLANLYNAWPAALRAHDGGVDDGVGDLCNRLSFMYGMPYRHQNLADVIHGSDTLKPELPLQFGAIPLKMYLHAARNLRAGQATFFEEMRGTDADFVSSQARARFHRLRRVTLITGALNRLWHRDSVDRMYEWLSRGTAASLRRIQKRILPTYAHQDLLWGTRSQQEVYPLIAGGLQGDGDPAGSPSPLASAH